MSQRRPQASTRDSQRILNETINQFGFFSNGRGPRSSLEHVSASAFAAAAMSCGRVWALTGALVVGYLAIYKYFSAHGLDLFYVHDLHPDRE